MRTIGKKYDKNKPDYSLIPPYALNEAVKVLSHGANKYGSDNWRFVDNSDNRYFAAAQRHLWAHKSGELNDPESGISHMAHAVCSLLFIIELAHITETPKNTPSPRWEAQQFEFKF